MLRILGIAVVAASCLSLGIAVAAEDPDDQARDASAVSAKQRAQAERGARALDSRIVTEGPSSDAISATNAPPEDNFANARAIGIPSTSSGTNFDASREEKETDPSCGVGEASVWFRLTPGTAGTLIATTVGSDFDTILALYSGSGLGSLTEVQGGCDDEGGGAGTSRLQARVSPGVTYYLRLVGYGRTAGNYILQVSEVDAPSNDDFERALSIGVTSSGVTSRTTGSTIGATKESGEPQPQPPCVAAADSGASVWFRITPTRSGTFTASAAGTNFDTVLTLYTGPSLAGLMEVPGGCNDDAGGALTSWLSTGVRSGSTYYLRLAGFRDATGSFVLETTFSGSGTLAALPNPVPAGQGLGSTRITWSTNDGSSAQVYVSSGGPEILFGEGVTGSLDAAWIANRSTYKFVLYQGSAHSIVLAEATVTRLPAFGTLKASPNPVPSGTGLGITAIDWSTSDGSVAAVYVSLDGAPEILLSQGSVGSNNAPWIANGRSYRFRLYRGSDRSVVLDEIVVTRPLSGTLSASPNPVPAGSGAGATTITWSLGDGSEGQVYVSMDGGSEILFSQGSGGSDAAPWILSGRSYTFRLYSGTSRANLLATTTVSRSS